MCSGFACGLVTVVIGAALVVTSTIVGFVVVPNLVRNGIIDEVVLLDNTIQMERFEEVPFPLDFKVRIFNITNEAEVKNGAVPVLTELGPYVYKLLATRQIEARQDDRLIYRKLDHFEFDAAASFPYSEDDVVYVANTPYHRNGLPGGLMNVYRGVNNPEDLGRITTWEGSPSLAYWTGSTSVCNMINGTDSGVFNPFVDTEHPLFALNSDICRSVELRYQNDVEYKGIPAVRFAANEWFLDNNDGCFCLNVTTGINRDDGCLLRGAMELFTCVGAYMVLSYPHFLFADVRYREGVVGMAPIRDQHRIFLDVEPNTGTVIRGAKRAQFNVFMRPVTRIAVTENLRTTLTPVLWVEEGMSLPEEFANELKSKLLSTLELVNLLVPIVVAVCCAVLLIGILIAVCVRLRRPSVKDVLTTNGTQ